jgi:hypothetical protein
MSAEKGQALDTGVKLAGPDECVRLLENGELNISYVPIEVGQTFKSEVDPADHGIIAMMIAEIASAVREIDVPNDATNQERDSFKLRYQVVKNTKTHYYRLLVEFPRGSHYQVSKINRSPAFFPNRINQDESEPFVTPNGLLGFRWMITMHGWFLNASATNIILLHDAPKLTSVTHVYSETIGRNNEGRGVKRMREIDEDFNTPISGRKS